MLAEGKKATAEVRDITLSLAARIKELTEQNTKLVDTLKLIEDFLPDKPDYNPRLGGDNKLRNIYWVLEELNIKD